MTKLLYTRSAKPLSRLICWAMNEPVSHVALQIGELVLHSHGAGVDIDHIKTFRQHYDVILEQSVPAALQVSLDAAAEYEAAPYDTLGLLFLGVRVLLWRWFGRALPSRNLWARSGHYTCVEFVTYLLTGQEYSVTSPYQLYKRLGLVWRQ